MGEYGAKCLGEGIAKCVTLTTLNLYLYDNSIGDNGVNHLGEGISKCAALTSLNLAL